jgi:hypothetical protein
MNGLCPACKQPVEVVDVRLGEGIVVVRCPACATEQRLALSESSGAKARTSGPPLAPAAAPPPPSRSAQPLAIEPAFEPPADFCPKCVSPRKPGSSSCPACGLVFGQAVATDLRPSAGLLSAFSALAARWDDASAQTRFLHLAAAGGELAAAGRLYRIRLAQVPGDKVARASLEATVKMASAPVSVAALKSAPLAGEVPGRRKKLLLVAVTVLGPSLLFALIRLLGRN